MSREQNAVASHSEVRELAAVIVRTDGAVIVPPDLVGDDAAWRRALEELEMALTLDHERRQR